MSATIPAADRDVEQAYDVELEEHAGDGEVCVKGDGPAAHVYRHPGCMAYICAKHAKNAHANIKRCRTEGRRLRCDVCGCDPVALDSVSVIEL